MAEDVRNPLERACDAAGRALRGTHDSLRDSSECSLNDAFILLDKHLNFVKMNHVARKMFGQFVGDVMGKNILEVFPDIKETERYYEYHRVMKTGEPFFADDFAPISKFGDVRLSVKAFKVGNGLGLIVSDLTERKRLQTRFAESEAKYQALVENSTDGIGISRGGQVIYANKAALEIFGFETVEEIGKASFLEMVVPEDMAFIEERIGKRLRGEPVESKFEVRILRGDRKVRNIEIYTSEIALNGEKFVQSIYRDITERRKIEEALRQNEHSFRILFDSTIDCMFVLDAETMKIVLANKAGLDMAKKCGFNSPEEIYSLNLLDYIPPEDRERVLRIIREDMFEKDLRQINEFRIVDGEGREIWISAVGTRTEYQGRLAGLLAVRDITVHKKAEEALRQSEEKLRNVLDSSVDMIYRANLKTGTYDYVSPAAGKVIGYLPEELTEKGLMGGRSLAHPDDLDRLDQNVIDLVMNGGNGEVPSAIEYRFKHKKLGYRWMYDNRSVVRDEEGIPVAVVGIFRDITERKQLEETLRESEEKSRALVEAAGRSGEGIIIVQDKEGREGAIVFANDEICRMSGYSRDELLNMTYLDFATDFEFGKELAERYRRRQRGEEVSAFYEVKSKRKDGAVFFVELSLALLSWQGKAATVAYVRDVTERKELEKELAESEARLNSFMNSATDSFLLFDADLNVVDLNKCAMDRWGLNKKDVLGKNVLDLSPHLKYTERYQKYLEVLKTGAPFTVEEAYEHPKLGKRYILLGAFKVGDGLGLIATDITERKKIENALRESEASYRELADSITDVFFAMDADLRYTYWNRASEMLTGIKAGDAIGKSIHEIFGEGDAIRRASDVYRKVLVTQRPQTFVNERDLAGKKYFLEIHAYPSKGGLSVFVKDITERRKAEDALRESEQKFKAIFDNANDGFISVEPESRKFFNPNKKMIEMLGYDSVEEVANLTVTDIHPEQVIPYILNDFEKHVQREVSQSEDIPVQRKDGSVFFASINSYEVTIANKKYLSCIFRDITERRKVEDALRRSEEYFHSLTDNAVDVILVIGADGVRKYVSPSIERVRGYKPEELIGKEAIEGVHPDDVPKIADIFVQLTENPGNFLQWECRLRHKDGTWHIVEGISRNLFDNPVVAGIVSNFRDISERREAEDVLRKSESKYRQLIESMYEGLWVIDKDACTTLVNPRMAEILGYSMEEMQGKSLLYFMDEDAVKSATFHLKRREQGIKEQHTFEFIRKDGAKVYTRLETSPIVDDEGVYNGAIAYVSDITELKKAEDALRESERKFRTVLENSVDVIYQVNLKTGKYDYLSPSSIKVLGYIPEEIMALTVEKAFFIVHPDDLAGVREHFKQLAASAKPGDKTPAIEYRVKHKESGYRCVIDSSSMLFDERGNAAAIVGTVHDITERKKAEDELWRTRERLQLMFDSVQDGVCVTDTEGRIVDVNPRGLEMYKGSTKEDLIGKSAYDLIVPGEQEKTIREFQMVLERGTTGLVEHNVVRADGSVYLAELTASMLKDISGNPTGFVAVLRDITERRKAEDALKESEEKYRALVDTAGLAGEGIMIVERNAEGKAVVAFANETLDRMLGYKTEEMIGMLGRELFLPGDRVLLHEKYKRRRKGEKLPSHSAVMALRKDGSMLPIELSMGAMNLNGKPATVVYIRDITDRKAAEEALKQSEMQFRAIFENAAMGVGIVDSRGHPLRINTAFEKMVDYTAEELRKTPFKAFMHPDDAFSDAKLFAEMVEGKRNQYAVEKRYIRKDGQIVWGRVTLSAVRDAKGKLSFAVGMVEDITESKMTLKKLQESEEYFRALIENAMDAIVVVRGDGSIGYGSPSIGRMLGYSPEEIVGPDGFRFAHPDDMPKVMDNFAEVMKGPRATVQTELRIQHKNGSWHIVEAVANNLLDNQAIAGIVVNWRDITERKKAEEERVRHTKRVEALHTIAQAASQTLELEELLNLALDKTLEVMEADLGGIYLMDVLEKELVLRASKGLPEDVVERVSSMRLGTRKIQEIQKWAEGSLRLEEVFGENVRGRVSKAIEKAQIKSYAVVPFFIRGQLYGLVAVGTRIRREFSTADIDLLKGMANQIGIGTHNSMLYEEVRALIRETLDAQEKERERVCLDVHDGVAQTLVAAFQYLQSLEVISPDEKDVRGLIAKATVQVKKAIQESREVINSLQPATLREVGLVPTLRHEMKRLEQETGLKVDFKADDIRLPKDIETGLYRIIHEAVFNARKHSNTKRLRVRINSVNGLVKVEVKDWGKGFAQAHLDSSKKRGTGLFSICKRAELMKGACDIQSAPGQGTTVYVEIPFTPAKG